MPEEAYEAFEKANDEAKEERIPSSQDSQKPQEQKNTTRNDAQDSDEAAEKPLNIEENITDGDLARDRLERQYFCNKNQQETRKGKGTGSYKTIFYLWCHRILPIEYQKY